MVTSPAYAGRFYANHVTTAGVPPVPRSEREVKTLDGVSTAMIWIDRTNRMNDERIIEELARIEGIWRDDIPIMEPMYGGPEKKIGERCSLINELPDYLHDHNAVQRIIDGMDGNTLAQYHNTLTEMIGGANYLVIFAMHQATCSQKCESILNAYGRWEA